MSSGPTTISATVWLLDAPTTNEQGRCDVTPDGAGVGVFDTAGRPLVIRQPIVTLADTEFARDPITVTSSTFVAHVRHASTGKATLNNTHPFLLGGRVFAHNGVIESLRMFDEHLGPAMDQVHGDTDSERYFALVNREIAAAGGDIERGVVTAARWIAANLPLYSINMVLATPTDLWALRYPDTNGLYVLHRPAGGRHGRHLDHASPFSEIRVRSADLADHPAVVVESERMDEDPRWRNMTSGELLHVGPDLNVTSKIVLSYPPAHALTLDDLRPEAAASQTTAAPVPEQAPEPAPA
jgi:glutamine amidotransferase